MGKVPRQLKTAELEKIANDIRMDVIKMLEHAGSGHSAGPLGLADIFTALYFKILKHDPGNPDWDERDILVLSSGHCVPVRYATMAHAGYFDKKELISLRQFGTRLQGHPERLRLPGMETTSGPLGSGLSQACGMALGLRMNKAQHRWVYVVMSDGELDEGNSWEAAMLASKYKLNNLVAIIDRNNIQIEGPTEIVMPLEDLSAKWESFGWHVLEIDGNDIEAVIDACAMAKAIVERPVAIVAHTIPGKGVDFMEYDFHWHGAPPNHEQAVKALKELRTLGGKIRSEHQ
ncbi:transketolase [Candidatus Saccharibacteria bacterium RIFCSPHIGHO2_12_FULL_49_19]|nr:MAG: transketolase [Candidatus Saccharibacteria bacterium RIFCSPHIGHO2_01_FULL_49_21]OGL37600.1 MAG: transketolase [Candidatus Saccharibacteria bacterium RIFCSPHIGHO2_12_FULL_49_19]OGL38127.1 MAG: transketolase [Candidatus Saccharibacteria bacterium RIFCSPLOWO2_01_FULL_49_22]